jgi:hypothetical protein
MNLLQGVSWKTAFSFPDVEVWSIFKLVYKIQFLARIKLSNGTDEKIDLIQCAGVCLFVCYLS